MQKVKILSRSFRYFKKGERILKRFYCNIDKKSLTYFNENSELLDSINFENLIDMCYI